MVEQDRADRRKRRKIIFVGRIVAVPGDHVERRMAELGHMELAAPFDDQPARRLLVLEPGDRRLEVARIGQAVGADRPAIGQRELGAVVLADIAARRSVDQLDLEHQAARQDADLARLDLDHAHLGDEAHAAHLRHDQQLAVGVEEMIVDHVGGWRHRHAPPCRSGRSTSPAVVMVRMPARKSVGSVGHRHRVPAILAERQLVVADIRRALPQRITRLA